MNRTSVGKSKTVKVNNDTSYDRADEGNSRMSLFQGQLVTKRWPQEDFCNRLLFETDIMWAKCESLCWNFISGCLN